VKNQIEEIVQKLQDHDEMLSRIDASMEKNANLADDSLKAVQASLKASLASLRDEMNRKLQAMTIEIAQLQKQMNVQRGEQNILAQQSKDTTKRLEVVAGHVTDLAAELHGDEAHVAVAGGATY
jgi:chromosome segregation ATPase